MLRGASEPMASRNSSGPPGCGLKPHRASVPLYHALVKRQGLVLSPIDVVLFTDGIPDTPAEAGDSLSKYRKIDLGELEYLSKSVTLRVLYPRPTVAVNWERRVPRHRVRMWTVDDEVMTTWSRQHVDSVPPEQQHALWKWIGDNVDHRVRSVGVL